MDKQFYKIKNSVDELDNISVWSDKYKQIQNIKNVIKNRKLFLTQLQESLNTDITETDDEFNDFDLDKVLQQIKKSTSIDKQVKSFITLKEWYANEKAKVLNTEKNENEN